MARLLTKFMSSMVKDTLIENKEWFLFIYWSYRMCGMWLKTTHTGMVHKRKSLKVIGLMMIRKRSNTICKLQKHYKLYASRYDELFRISNYKTAKKSRMLHKLSMRVLVKSKELVWIILWLRTLLYETYWEYTRYAKTLYSHN